MLTGGLAALIVMSAPSAALAAIQASLLPALQSVAPGAEFEVRLEIPSAGFAFNAFDAVVQYDPAVLTFLPTAPTTLQQGCLVTGGCSASCGTTFHLFSAAGDSLRVNNSLLCNGVTITGPGRLYTLRFLASNTPQVTALSIRRNAFFSAGLLVTPVTTTSCQIGIGIALDVPPREGGALRVKADPNPAYGSVRITISDASALPLDVDVLDISGRTIRHLAKGRQTGGSLVWNGATDSGSLVPAGIYLIRVHAGGLVRHTRVAWLP